MYTRITRGFELSKLAMKYIVFSVAAVLALMPAASDASSRPEGSERPALPSGRAPVDWAKVLEENSPAPQDEWRSHLLVAAAYANTGQMARANDQFRILSSGDYRSKATVVIHENTERLKACPDDILALNSLAFAYYAMGEDQKSAACFERLINLDPRNVWLTHYLAYLYTRLSRIDDAISLLRRSLEIDPRNEYTHLLLGLAYQQKGWTLAAFVELLKAPNARREALKYLSPPP